MNIDKLMLSEGASIYYDENFRKTLSDHFEYLRTHKSTSTVAVDSNKAYQWESDFSGLLVSLRVPLHLHWLIMRLNGIESPMESRGDILELLIPDTMVVDRIRQSYMSKRKN